VALTRDFSGNPEKQAQWVGFIGRMKVRDVRRLAEVADGLLEFLMPAMRAISKSEHLNLNSLFLAWGEP
jgi:hypothetical protein